jgi:dTDP-4-dehydrorhamnose reductase
MKILILGGSGMLGHTFMRLWRDKYDIKTTLKHDFDYYDNKLFNSENSFVNLDILDESKLLKIMDHFSPDIVINCIGITKQIINDLESEVPIQINSLFPHKLSKYCRKYNSRLFLLSTDCIFSGRKGFYSENDISDAEDLYGRSKYLGEVTDSNVITLRKSTIGLELNNKHGLIEWFLEQSGQVKGYKRAIYSGLTSSVLVDVIEEIMLNHTCMSGIWTIASKPISKYSILKYLADRIENDIDIEPDNEVICDRSLDGSRFKKETGIIIPKWEDMLDSLVEEINNRKRKQ